MKRALTFALALLLLLALCACGSPAKPKGAYREDSMGMFLLRFSGDQVRLETLDSTTGEAVNVENGTFTMDGNTILVRFEDGETDVFSFDRDNNTLSYMGLFTFYHVK